jgi:acetyl esterase/lipase
MATCIGRARRDSVPRLLVAIGVIIGLSAATDARAQSRVEKNVIYGMYSGLALLMDIHYPAQANGYGIVFVSGSGWQAPLNYGAVGLKEAQIPVWGPPLLRAGYTVFAINHRAAPRFHYPTAVEDVQRAVRFVRHHARQFGIDPNRLGGIGGSSGAHLIGLVAMLGAAGIADDTDPVNREPATLQTVVLRAAPTDLTKVSAGAVISFMDRLNRSPDDEKLYRAASPLTHVSSTAPPVLLLHGDSDDTVPFDQSVAMEGALRRVNVPVTLVRVAGGEHGPDFGTPGKPHPELPAVFEQTVAWLDGHLKSRSTSTAK